MSAEVYSIHVKVDSTQATTAAKDLGKLETAAGKAENSLKQLNSTSGNTASAAKTLSGAMDSTEASMRKATGAIESVGKAANAVRGAFVVLIGVEVARFMREMASTVREAADAYTQLTSRLAVGTVSQIEAGKAMRDVTQIANKYFLSIADVGNAYSKLNPILADMGRNQADTRTVVESVSAALAIQNGATVDSAETMRQLSQALSGNVLQMEEMNTIIDSAQPLWRGLNKVFAESVAKFGSLKNAISSQAITSEMLTDALIRLKPEFEELAARNTPTLAKAMTVLNNNFITYIGEADKAQGASKELGKMILDLADNLDKVLDPWMEFGKATGEAGVAFGKLATELAPALEIIAKGLAGFFTTVSTSLEGLKLLADGLGAVTGNVEKLKGLLGVNEAVVSDRTLERINKELQLNKEKLSQYSEMDRYKLLDAQKIKDLEKEIDILTRMKELVFANADAKRKAEEEETKRIDAQRQANKRPEVVDEKAAKKAREQAEKNFEAMIKFQVAEAENAAKLEKEKLETKLKLLDREKKAIETTADLEASSVKTKTERLAIYSDEMSKLEEKYVKEYEIKQSMLQLEVDLAEKRIEAVDTLISKQQEFGNTEADLLGLQKERADLVNELSIIQEEANRLDLEAKYEIAKSAENYNKELAKTEDQTKNVREEALRTLETLSSNLEYSRELARGLADAFGEVGAAIGGMSVAMAEYDKQSATVEIARQEAITKAAGDQKKIDEANTTAAKKQSQAEIKKYGDMTQAAQGFFKKGTAGYKAMETATKAFRALEIAQQAMSFAQQLGSMEKLFGSFETMLKQMGILSDVYAVKDIANSQAKGTAKAAEGAANQGSSGDPYTAFARVAAWIALMAGIGFMVGGGGGSAPKGVSVEDIRKQQDEAFAKSTATVLGSDEASQSIKNSLEIISENSSNDLDYTKGMARNMELLVGSIASLSTAIAKNFNFDVSKLNLGVSSTSRQQQISPIADPLMKAILGGTKISRELIDQGIAIAKQTFGSILAGGSVKAEEYANILVTKTDKALFGLFSSTQQHTERQTRKLDPAIKKALGQVFDNAYATLIDAGKLLGKGGAEFEASIKEIKIKKSDIKLGKNAEENAKKLEAWFSAQMDMAAEKAFPDMKEFQRAGEGMYETSVRVAEGVARAKGELAQLGIKAIDYTKIISDQKDQIDVGSEVARQSLLAQAGLTEGAKEYIKSLRGVSGEIIASYEQFVVLQKLMRGAGLDQNNLDIALITASGGVDKLSDSLSFFYENFLSDEEKVASKTKDLTEAFGKLGLTLPKSNDEFARLVRTLGSDTSEAGKQLWGNLIKLTEEFYNLTDASKELADAQEEAAKAAAEAAWKQQEALLKAEEKRLQDIQKAQEDVAAQAKKAYDEAFNALSKAFSDLEKVQDRYVAVGKTLLQFYRELTGAKMPMASPEERYRLARQELERVRTLAAIGDETALAQLVDAGKDFLDASKEYNASSAAYQQDYQLVLKTLEEGQAYAQAQVNIAQAQLDMAKAQYSQLQKVDTSVLTTTQAVSNLTTAMSSFANASVQNTAAAIAAANSAAAVAAAAAATAAAAAAAAKTPITQPNYSGGWTSAVNPDGSRTFYNPPSLVAPGILARAEGGATPPGMTLVGEEGPELVTFGSSSYISTASQTEGFFSGIQETIRSGDAMQVNELQALVRLQSAANQQLIKEMRELKGEMAELARKAKLEAAA